MPTLWRVVSAPRRFQRNFENEKGGLEAALFCFRFLRTLDDQSSLIETSVRVAPPGSPVEIVC